MAHNIDCEPTLKHHQQHKSININPIHTRCNQGAFSSKSPLLQRRSSFLTIIQPFVASTKASQPSCHTLCKPTLKHHQYKHHQRHKSININPIYIYLLPAATIIQPFVTPAYAKATYTNQIQPDQSEPTIMAHTLCKPTLKQHQYKHHQQHKSININPALACILQRRSLTSRTLMRQRSR